MRTFRYRVILLDDTIIERDLEKKAVGQVLFDKACDYLSLLERDYFGLALWDSANNKVWLDLSKQIHKQIISHDDATFTFSVKFYPPDPSVLAEDITKYLLCLQLWTDILTSRLPCPSDMLAVLGSYVIQSEFGDFDPEVHGKEFFSNIPLAPSQTSELEENVAELYRTLRSMSPAEADQLFLQNVKTLDMYGIHLHPAKDVNGDDVMVGVCADGLVVYEDDEKTQSFNWSNVVNMSYTHSKFLARIFDSEDASENIIKFSLPSYRACKYLWENAAEHNAFFRNLGNQDKTRIGLLQFGSRFRFSGLTHAESLVVSANIQRPAPRISRSTIKRKAKESLLVALKRPNRTECDDWFQVLDSEESRPTYSPDKDKLSIGETVAYKERREKVNELDNEWFQLLGGRSFPTQHSMSTLSSEKDTLGSSTFQLRKLQADDWFVLLEPHTYQPTSWTLKNLPYSLQSSQVEDHSEDLALVEKSSEKSIKVMKIRKEVEAPTEQHDLMRSEIVGELEIGANEQILEKYKVMGGKLVKEGDGKEMQTVVMNELRTQEVESYSGQSQNVFVEQRLRGMEEVDTLHKSMLVTRQVVSEENIEELEDTLLELESIEQRLQDIERLKVKLQEVEFLEQKLQEVQQGGKPRGESDDWYILLEHKLMGSSAPAQLVRVETSEQKIQDIIQKRQEQGDQGDWYHLLDRKPLVLSSKSAVGEITVTETQLRLPAQREEQIQKQVDDDWFIQQDVSPKEPVFVTNADVYKEARGEELQLGDKQVKIITFEEGRREMIETFPEVVQTKGFPSVEQKTEITQWIEEKHKRASTAPSVQKIDDWYILLEDQRSTQAIQTALPSSVGEITVTETQLRLPAQREEQIQKQVDDDWFIQQDVSPKEPDVYKEARGEELQLGDKQVKIITFEEGRREMIETFPEVVQTISGTFEDKGFPSVEQKTEITQWIEEKHKRASTAPSVQKIDDWYILLEDQRSTQAIQTALPSSVGEINVTETQLRLPAQREEQIQKQVDDDWFIQQDVSPKEPDVYKEARGEELQLGDKQVKIITFEEGRREMIETFPEVVQTISGTFEDKGFPSAEQKTEITQWIEEKHKRASTAPSVQKIDDWYILLEDQRSTQAMKTALPSSDGSIRGRETQPILAAQRIKRTQKQVDDDWFILHDVSPKEAVPVTLISEQAAGQRPQQTVTIKEKEVTVYKRPMTKQKPVIVRGMEKKIPVTMHEDEDNWFEIFAPEQIEKKAIATAGVSDTWILEEKGLREVQKVQLREDLKRSQVVEEIRLHPYVPGLKAEVRHRELIDDWFILLEPASKESVSMDKRAEEDQRRKDELLRKQAMAEDKRIVAGKHGIGFKPSVAPVITRPPADQPMTSTPTAQSVHITRPTYQEDSLKRLDITQEITQDIKQESKVETEVIIMKKRREKRIEGESIYIRHSILMLEDSDVTQEVILRHHASVSELKRIFMEDMPVFGPTEWDKRLLTYHPVVYSKLSNGELFNGIDLNGADGLSIM